MTAVAARPNEQSEFTPIAPTEKPTSSSMPQPEKGGRPRRTRLFQWVPTDEQQLAEAERHMLAPIADTFVQEHIAGINTIYHVTPGCSRTVVLIHGFAGGVGNWLPNWRALIATANVYAIDLPGFARSHRPNVDFKTDQDAIDFMIDSIHAWVRFVFSPKTKLDLVGHSFGAFVASHYAMRYSSQIERLVLADPWGVPARPKVDPELPLKFRIALGLFYTGNPLSVLRAAGPWGPSLLSSVRSDFGDRWRPYLEDPSTFYDYTYHCNAHHPTGEKAFKACCHGTAFARQPLIESLPKRLDLSIGLGIIYGQNTWMDKEKGFSTYDAFVAVGGRGLGTRVVPDAGHQVMSDNGSGFSAALMTLLGLAA